MDGKFEELVKQTVESVPPNLSDALQNWLNRARSGELAEVQEQLRQEAAGLWDTFENATDEVDKKIQE